jgi:peroxidase
VLVLNDRFLGTSRALEVDVFVSEGRRSFLYPFQDSLRGVAGLDWAAFSIQRGREQGLPDYNSLREAYGLRRRPYVVWHM